MKKLIGVGVLAFTMTAVGGCAVRSYHSFGPPPPPPPAAVARYRHVDRVWIPGYQRWTGHGYRWVPGHWAHPPRPGMVWVPGYRAPRHGTYVWIEGYWR